MIARASLAALFAVLLAASRPVPTGGNRDLFVVGVRYERVVDGRAVPGFSLAVPTGEALRAYDLLLRGSARQALLQGSTVYATLPPAEETATPGLRIREVIYYGRRSRASRAPVILEEGTGEAPAGAADLREAARAIVALPPAVTTASARVLLAGTPDAEAWGEGLAALLETDPAGASALALEELRRPSMVPGEGDLRRARAVKALVRLGGARVYPALFARLARDDDPLVSGEARSAPR